MASASAPQMDMPQSTQHAESSGCQIRRFGLSLLQSLWTFGANNFRLLHSSRHHPNQEAANQCRSGKRKPEFKRVFHFASDRKR
jgi:hypothetical protein